MRHRLEQRETEPFVDRRKYENLRPAINVLKLRRIEVVEMMDVAAAKARYELLRLPTDAPDDDKRSVVLAAALQVFECIEEDTEVLARLDGADEQNVAFGEGG